jgi:membrane protease YdiL (CAAX protease family)
VPRRLWPVWAAFIALFAAYQITEGIGIHLLERPAVQAGLLLLFFPIAWALARLRGYRGLDAYAMELHPGWARNLSLTMLVAMLAKAGAVAAGLSLGVYEIEPPGLLSWQIVGALLGIVFTTFWPSVAEDVVTRGFWFRQVPALGRGLLFVLFSSGVYVLNHVYRLQNGPLEWLMLFAFGLAYATALVRTGSLWAAIGLHWGWNIAAFAAGNAGVTTRVEWASPLLSAAAHLVALGAVVAMARVLEKAERAGEEDPAPRTEPR